MALVAHVAVPLAGYLPVFERASTPAMQLCWFVADALNLPAVPGKVLAAMEWTVLVSPVQLRQLTLHADDFRFLMACTRAFALSACEGDHEAEARLWRLRRLDGPFVSHLVPQGVAFFSP